MIDITKLKESDRDKKVIYKTRYGKIQEGRITSWNERFVFVDYYNSGIGVPTNPKDINFI